MDVWYVRVVQCRCRGGRLGRISSVLPSAHSGYSCHAVLWKGSDVSDRSRGQQCQAPTATQTAITAMLAGDRRLGGTHGDATRCHHPCDALHTAG